MWRRKRKLCQPNDRSCIHVSVLTSSPMVYILTAWFNLAPEIQSIRILHTAVVSQYICIQRIIIPSPSPWITPYRIKHMSISDPRNIEAICTENISSAWCTRLQSFWWCFLILSNHGVSQLSRSSRIFPMEPLNSHARLFVTVKIKADGVIHAKVRYDWVTTLLIFNDITL